MKHNDDADRRARTILRRVCDAARVTQAFLFDSEGDLFWSARKPVAQLHVDQLRDALEQTEAAGRVKERPFAVHDFDGRFSVFAFSKEDDIFVTIFHTFGADSIEARLWPIAPILSAEIEELSTRAITRPN